MATDIWSLRDYVPSTCLRRLSDTRVSSRTEGYAPVRHHRLKDMHRLGQDVSRTFYLTALLAGQSLGPQVVAISQTKILSRTHDVRQAFKGVRQ